MLPCQRNTPHKELIRLTHALGRINVEHQKVVIPAITVFISSNRPAKDRDLTLHDENFVLICCRRPSLLRRVSFWVHNGTPSYRTGRDPRGIPVENCTRLVSAAVRPEAKNDVLWTLTARPERCSKSLRTCRTA